MKSETPLKAMPRSTPHEEVIHAGPPVLRFPNGVTSGNWYSEAENTTQPYILKGPAAARIRELEAENKDLRDGWGAPDPVTAESLSKLAWKIAVDMELHAAIGTTTKKKAEDITATLSALSPTPVSVEEAAQLARDVVTMIDTMTDTAMRIGLAGTSDWDQLAGKVDIYEIQDRARALSEGEG